MQGEEPDYIKIDVDGVEDEVVGGMRRTLANGRVKSLVVEVESNTRRSVIDILTSTGFEIRSEAQCSVRTSNIVFVRSSVGRG